MQIYKNTHACIEMDIAFVMYLYIFFCIIYMLIQNVNIQLISSSIHNNRNKYFYTNIHENTGEGILTQRYKNWQQWAFRYGSKFQG